MVLPNEWHGPFSVLPHSTCLLVIGLAARAPWNLAGVPRPRHSLTSPGATAKNTWPSLDLWTLCPQHSMKSSGAGADGSVRGTPWAARERQPSPGAPSVHPTRPWNPHSQRKRSSLLDSWSGAANLMDISLTSCWLLASPCRPRTVSTASCLSPGRWPSETA